MDVKFELKKTPVTGPYVKGDLSHVRFLKFKKGLVRVAYFGDERDIAFLYSYFIESDGSLPEKYRAADEWAHRPYLVLPQDDGTALVIVPSWLDLNVGWLINDTGNYRIYRVDHYALWAGLVPEEFRDLIELPQLNLQIIGDHLVGPDRDLEEAWQRYRKFLSRRDEKGIRIREGEKWNLLLSLVRDGILPFSPTPVKVRNHWKISGLELRDYQDAAYRQFLLTGAITVVWPPGAGKTTFAIACIAAVSGRTLVVVPSISLVQRWLDELRRWLPKGPRISVLYSGSRNRDPGDITITTYQTALKKFAGSGEDFDLLIVDEAHHLPADTFSKLATIKTKYRIALTASPFREDGRTELIYALGGFPIATSWEDLVKRGFVRKPEVIIYTTDYKLQALLLLLRRVLKEWKDGKILIYSDYIDEGKKIAKAIEEEFRIHVPFIHGNTSLRDRYDLLEEHRVVVVSRVFDEGIDIPNLVVSIEYGFLYGSRRQELQRAGRLMHSLFKGVKHYVIMDPEEFEDYKKRFLSLIGRGIEVRMGDVKELLKDGTVLQQTT